MNPTAPGPSVAVICTVGSRDVKLDGKKLEPARSEGERVLATLPSIKNQLEFPIIEPVLKHAMARGRLTRVALIVTDQPDEAYRPSDTLHFGQILKRLLPERIVRLGPDAPNGVPVAVHAVKANPTLTGPCAQYLLDNRILTETFNQLDGVDRVILSATGGAPGLNLAIQFICYSRLRQRLDIVHVNESTGLATSTRLVELLERQGGRDEVAALLQRFDFVGAAARLEGLTDLRTAWYLARLGACRLAFDFSGAIAAANELLPLAPDLDGFLSRTIRALMSFNDPDPTNQRRRLSTELLGNLWIKWHRGEYIDLLGRLFRVLEEAVIELAEQSLGGPIGAWSRKSGTYPSVIARIEASPPIQAQLASATVHGEPLDWKQWNIDAGLAIIRGFLAAGAVPAERRDHVEQGCATIERWLKLKQLRNKSILAHGFNGASREDFNGADMADNFETHLDTLAHLFGITNYRDPWAELRTQLLKKLA